MSENTANADHKKEEYAEVCIGQMIPNEIGLDMPPKYAYRIDFNGSDVMVIPLEGNWKVNSKGKNNREEKAKGKMQRQARDQKAGIPTRRGSKQETSEERDA